VIQQMQLTQASERDGPDSAAESERREAPNWASKRASHLLHRIRNASDGARSTTVICGPRYTGKQAILNAIAAEAGMEVTRVNVASYAARPEPWLGQGLEALRADRQSHRGIVVLDCIEVDAKGELVTTLMEALGDAMGYLLVSNIPQVMLERMTKKWQASMPCIELTYEEAWKHPPLSVRARRLSPSLRSQIYDDNVLNSHPYLGGLLVDAVLNGRVEPDLDLLKAWHELAARVWRPFFQERGDEIRRTPSQLRACRALFASRTDRTVQWEPENELGPAYSRLAEWGIVQPKDLGDGTYGMTPASPVMRAWLRFTFAADNA
jgi:hypothetical protein